MKPSKTDILIVLPPAMRGPGMLKSPPLEAANLTALLRTKAVRNIALADFRKIVLKDPDRFREMGIDLGIMGDFTRALRYFLTQDPEIYRTAGRILSGIDLGKYQYVIFSVMVLEQFSLPHLLSSLCLAQRVKREFPSIKIILYGNVPDAHIEKIMKMFKFVDAFPVGGNEAYVGDYIQGSTEGVYCRKNGKLLVPSGGREVDISRFPVPDFSLFDLDSYRYSGGLVLPFEFSRARIDECSHFYYIQKGKVSFRDPVQAAAGLITLSQKYGTEFFHFMDVDINADPVWLTRFCEDLALSSKKVKWCALAYPNMDKALLEKLRQAGCVQLRWAVEYGSERMLRNVGRGTTKATIKNSLAQAHFMGINNYITLVTGLPGERESDIVETRDFIREIAPYVDSAKECPCGEVGHFSLGIFKSLVNNVKVTPSQYRYDEILKEWDIGQEDIIDFMTQTGNVR